MNEFHMAAEDRPLDIFSARIRSFLIFILPVGALSYIPACFLLGKVSVFFMAFFSLWLFAMGLAIFRFWNFSFRRYESAMG